MTPATMLRAGAMLGATGVAAGAFGAHGLQSTLNDLGSTATFETAVRYHLVHALALVLCVPLDTTGFRTGIASRCFLAGTVLFSGSLYALALNAPRALGMVTPLGGLILIAGWITLVLAKRS